MTDFIYRQVNYPTNGGWSGGLEITEEKALTMGLDDSDWHTGVVYKIKIIDGNEYIVADRYDGQKFRDRDTPILFESVLGERDSDKKVRKRKKRELVLNRIKKYKLEDVTERVNEGTFLFCDHFYYYTAKKQWRRKGTQIYTEIGSFDYFYKRKIKPYIEWKKLPPLTEDDILNAFN